MTALNQKRNFITDLSAAGGGVGQIANNNAAKLWVVRQISLISNPTSSGATCTVKWPIGIVDTSYFAGTGDVAGGDPPIYLYSGEYLELVWEGGPANGQGIASVIFDEVDV